MCNLHCLHCRAKAPQKVPLIEGDRLEYLLNELEKLSVGLITLSGGEVLTRKDAILLARKAVEHGMRVRIQTNGLLLSEDNIRALKEAGICNIGTGLDGVSDTTYNYLRQKEGAFKTLLNNIEIAKAQGMKMSVECVITPNNLPELDNIIDLADNIGIDLFLARMALPISYNYPNELLLSKEDYKSALSLIADKTQQKGHMILNSQDPLYVVYNEPLRSKIIGKYGDLITSGGCIGGCTAGINMFYLNPLGDVYPCSFLPVKAGNIFEQPLDEIWETAEVFQLLRNRENLEGKCGKCEYTYICGGCRARALFLGSGIMGEDPYCLKFSAP